MRQFGAGVIWEGFLEVELNQVLKARKKGEREERERGPGKENGVNNDTKDVYSWGGGGQHRPEWLVEGQVRGRNLLPSFSSPLSEVHLFLPRTSPWPQIYIL